MQDTRPAEMISTEEFTNSQSVEHTGGRCRGPSFYCAVVAMAILIITLTLAAFYLVRSGFWSYDDVGYLMITQKTFFAGHALYDQTYTQYGPAYYLYKRLLLALTGLPLSHNSTIIFTLFAWIATALLCAGYVARLTRSLALAALTFFAEVSILIVIRQEAGHPQELCALLLGTMLFGGSLLGPGRREPLVLSGIGFLVGTLVMTKTNLGVYAAIAGAIALLKLAPAGSVRNVALGASILAAVVLPVALMRHSLKTVGGYCLLETVAILLFVRQLKTWEPERRLSISGLLGAVAGLAGGLIGNAGYALATGSSIAGLWRGLVLQHVNFDMILLRKPLFVLGEVFVSVICVGCFWLMTGPARCRWRIPESLQSVLQAAMGPALVGTALLFDLAGAFVWGLPLLSIAALLPARQSRALPEVAPRLFGIALALFTGLWGYPVMGYSQAALSFFLLVPVLLVVCADAVRYGNWSPRFEQASAKPVEHRAARLRTVWHVASWILIATLIAFSCVRLSKAKAAYARLAPLELPGASLLRVDPGQAKFFEELVRTLQARGKTFFAMPGLGSLYFWTQMEPPTTLNAGHWMTLFAPDQQERVVEDLKKTDGLCVVRWNRFVRFWVENRDLSQNKIVRYIEDNFVVVQMVGDAEIMMRRQ